MVENGTQNHYIRDKNLPNEEAFPQTNLNMGPSSRETKTSEVEHEFMK